MLAAVFTALAAVAVAAPATAAPSAASDDVSFRFAWPADLSASVQFERERTGSSPRPLSRARARLAVADRDGHLHVRYRDLAPEAPSSAIEPLVQAAEKLTTVVRRDGTFVRLDGMQDAVEAIRRTVEKSPGGSSPEARQAVSRLQQMAPAILTKDASENWAMLVQFWHGNTLKVGADYQSDSTVPVPALQGESIHITATIRVERRLPCPSGGGECVEVRMRSEPSATDVARVTKKLMDTLTGERAKAFTSALNDMSVVNDFLLVTEPTRLIPHRYQRVRTMKMSGASPGAAADAKDVYRCTFTYPATRASPRTAR